MSRIFVEDWSPEYGSSFQSDPELTDDDRVDDTIEVAGPWQPMPGVDDGIDRVAFVDGVRRIDARLTLDDSPLPVPGLCGTFAVGAVEWHRGESRSEVTHALVDRLAVFGSGRGAPMPVAGSLLLYRTESVPESDPGALIQRFHGAMRRAEARLSEELAQGGVFVIADGPINDLSATEKVGYVKSHRAPYLSPERAGIIADLGAGQRTPLFLIGAGGAYPRYSWYLRLARTVNGHSWSGIARAEVSSHLDIDSARLIADRTTALLPIVASEPHIDPRAPQNLVPIGALERELRRLMGDPGIVYRALRAAVHRQAGVADE